MLAHHFVEWCETATSVERCAGVVLLAEAVTKKQFLPSEIRQAEAALMFALNDPSPLVRRTMALHTASSDLVPRQLILSLCRDVDPVAIPVVEKSPLLRTVDLIELVRTGTRAVRTTVARRNSLSHTVAAALIETGEADVCLELARNDDAELSRESIRTFAQMFQANARVRHALLQRDDLPAGVRHDLVVALAADLSSSPFVLKSLGSTAAGLLEDSLCDRATTAMSNDLPDREIFDFVEHLRGRGRLNAALLIRAACNGRLDLLSASLARLSGHSEKRVRAIVADARQPAFGALLSTAGLPHDVQSIVLKAVRTWKDMSSYDDVSNDDQSSAVLEGLIRSAASDASGLSKHVEDFLHQLLNEAQHTSARRRAEHYLAA